MSFDITDPGNAALLIGSLCIAGSIYYSFSKATFIKKGHLTKGTVVDTVEPSSIDGRGLAIKVKFTTDKHREITFTEQVLSANRYPINSVIDVIYDQKQPEIAHINKNKFLWAWEVMFFVGGAGMVFIGLFGE